GFVELVQEVAGGAFAASAQGLLAGSRQHEQDRPGSSGFGALGQLDSVGRGARAARRDEDQGEQCGSDGAGGDGGGNDGRGGDGGGGVCASFPRTSGFHGLSMGSSSA